MRVFSILCGPCTRGIYIRKKRHRHLKAKEQHEATHGKCQGRGLETEGGWTGHHDIIRKPEVGLPWWSSGYESALSMQGAQI